MLSHILEFVNRIKGFTESHKFGDVSKQNLSHQFSVTILFYKLSFLISGFTQPGNLGIVCDVLKYSPLFQNTVFQFYTVGLSD